MCVWTAGCDVIRKVSLHFPCERADGKSRRPVHEAEEAAWLWNFLDFLVCVRVRVLYFFSRVKLSAVLSDHALKKKKKKCERDALVKARAFGEMKNCSQKQKEVLRLVPHRMPRASISRGVRIRVSTFSLPGFIFVLFLSSGRSEVTELGVLVTYCAVMWAALLTRHKS